MKERKWQTESFWKSFKCAVAGIIYALKTQRNIIIQLFISIFAISFSVIFEISKVEWAIIIFTIMFVIFAEMLNTAVESVVDLITEEYSEKAKIAKDVAAGAVLVSAINAICMGLIIFGNKIF